MGKDSKEEDYKFTNRGMFNWVLGHYSDLCIGVLSRILRIEISSVSVDDEVFIEPKPGRKAGILDIVATDENGAKYDVEMQTLKIGNLRKRSRYYHSLIDSDLIKKGADHSELPDIFVIFVCLGDFLEEGEPLIEYEMRSSPDLGSRKLLDGRHVVFLSCNLYNKVNEEEWPGLAGFMEFTYSGKATDGLTRGLEEAVSESNKSTDARNYMNWDKEWQRYEDAARREGEEGRAKGRAEGRAEVRALVAQLASRLAEDGRTDELVPAMTDMELQEQLMKEYGLM